MEHFGTDSDVMLVEDEPTTIIAYALSSRRYLGELGKLKIASPVTPAERILSRNDPGMGTTAIETERFDFSLDPRSRASANAESPAAVFGHELPADVPSTTDMLRAAASAIRSSVISTITAQDKKHTEDEHLISQDAEPHIAERTPAKAIEETLRKTSGIHIRYGAPCLNAHLII
jgi:hypothetical protein